MNVLADRLDSMKVRVSAPGGKLAAELRNRSEVELRFARGSYQWYSERSLETQLASLGKLLWAARMKGYHLAVSEALGEPVAREAPPVTPRDQAFYAARDRLVAEGRPADGRVAVAVRGMRDWQVTIANGTLRALNEDEFAARVNEAAGKLINDQQMKVWELKQRYYE